jgi:integrase
MRRRDFGTIFTRRPRPGFYCRFVWDGRTLTRHAGPEKDAAREKLSAAHALLSRGTPLPEVLARCFGDVVGARMTFRDAVTPYLDYARTRKRASTYATDVRHFAVIGKGTWTGKLLGAIRPGDIEGWIDSRLAEGTSPATVNRQTSLCSALYRWAVRLGYVEHNPFRRVPKLSEKGRERETYLTGEESRALVAVASPDFRPFLVAALSTGARRGELLKLTWADVDFPRREIVIRPENEKAGRGRVVPLTADLLREMEALRARINVTPLSGSGPVFVQPDGSPASPDFVKGSLRRAVASCPAIPAEKKPRVTCHALRHSFASTAVAAGVPIFDVAKLLGHGDVRLTAGRYAHFAPESGRAAVDRIGNALGLSARASEAVAGGSK